MLTERFERALAYANRVHAGQVRKGTSIPYIAHLLSVVALVLEHAGNEDEAIGALLHDAVEDGGGKTQLEEIRRQFGEGVAVIVEGCSDTCVTPKPPWESRKAAYIGRLRHEPESVRLVSAADKLANVRSLIEDYRAHGEELWQRFNAPREKQLWYYRALADEFSARGPSPIARVLDEAVGELESRVARPPHSGADWLYCFTRNAAFPEPLAEVSALGALADEGKTPFLMLAHRGSPPMARASKGEVVLLCSRAWGKLACHGEAVIAGSPRLHSETPEDVVDLYGRGQAGHFVELGEVRLSEARPVTELAKEDLEAFLKGRAYAKRLRKMPQLKHAAKSRETDAVSSERPPTLSDSLNVVGLDPTAGTWASGMEAGPKAMRSVNLAVVDGRIVATGMRVHTYLTNSDFLQAVSELGPAVVCIDGPCATNGLKVRDDWSGWDETQQGAAREAERKLARMGIALFWTTLGTVTRFDGASRWIARSLRLFGAAAQYSSVRFIETHPHGAFTMLAKHFGILTPLAPKTTPTGRHQRLAILHNVVEGLDPGLLADDDAVDAACAAVVAALFALGRARRFGSEADGGEIWMPA